MAGIGKQTGLPSVLTDEQLASAQLLPRKRPWTWVCGGRRCAHPRKCTLFDRHNSGFGWPVVVEYFFSPQVMAGLFTTLMLTAISMTLALLWASSSRLPPPATIRAVVGRQRLHWIFRAIPLLVQIIFWYNLAALYPKLGFGIPFLPPLVEFDTNSVITAISAGHHRDVPERRRLHGRDCPFGPQLGGLGQREAARALGMSSWNSFDASSCRRRCASSSRRPATRRCPC